MKWLATIQSWIRGRNSAKKSGRDSGPSFTEKHSRLWWFWHDLQKFQRDFEPQTWHDWALLPLWAVRWLFFWLLHSVVSTLERHTRLRVQSGRHTDLNPVWCQRCGWTGPVRWLVHMYHSYYVGGGSEESGDYDSEPVDECPRCGQEL